MKYELKPNEGIILQTINVKRVGGADFADELILTNLNIIYVDRGMLTKRVVNVKYYPLNRLKMLEGKPQVIKSLNGKNGASQLTIQFNNESVSFQFSFRSNRNIKKWIKKITEVSTGEKYIDHGNAIPGAKKTVRIIRDTIGAVGSVLKEKKTSDKIITVKCSACKASMSGNKNQVLICEYCGKKQKLK